MLRLAIVLLLALVSTSHADTAKRLALVVGNDIYRSVTPLRNARADAREVAKALTAAGFDVTVKYDLGDKALKEALRNFKAQVNGGDDTVFYFSGHGVQLGAANYLLPVDIASETEDQVKDDALPLQRVLDDLQDQKARFTLAIVDACRNNPFKNKGRSIGGRGLVPVNPTTGQMVLYSAGAGQQALDRLDDHDSNPNGVFTRVLIKEMNQPGVPLDQVLREVRDQVVMLTKGVKHDQVPALYDQTVGKFYLVPGRSAGQKLAPQGPDAPAASDVSLEDIQAEAKRRTNWDAWQGRMRGNYNKVAAMDGSPDLKAQAWERFLATFPETNPYSREADTLREQVRAAQRQAQRLMDRAAQPLDVLSPATIRPLPGHVQPDNQPHDRQQDMHEESAHAIGNLNFGFPTRAFAYGHEGRVTVRVQVLADGTAGQMWIKQSSGSGILDVDAREQLAKYHFKPALKNGQPVTAWIDVPVDYRLNAESKP
jgi:TonB family protein